MTKKQKEYALTLKRVIRNDREEYTPEQVNKALKLLLDFLNAIESYNQG